MASSSLRVFALASPSRDSTCRNLAPINESAEARRLVSIFWPTPVRSLAYRAAQTDQAMQMPAEVSIRGLDQTHDGTPSRVLVSEATMPVMAWTIMS